MKMTVFYEIKKDKKLITAAVVLILSNLFIYNILLGDNTNNTTVFKAEFPSNISGWTSTEVEYDPAVIATLRPDKTVYKTYYREGNSPITLFIAGYNSLEKADLSHSPIVCFTGQGWDIIETGIKKIMFDSSDNQVIKVNQMIQKKADDTMVTFYWYQSKNRSFSNRGKQKIYLFYQKLIGNSHGNAFVRLTTMVDRDKSQEKSIIFLNDFMKELYPELKRYFN